MIGWIRRIWAKFVPSAEEVRAAVGVAPAPDRVAELRIELDAARKTLGAAQAAEDPDAIRDALAACERLERDIKRIRHEHAE